MMIDIAKYQICFQSFQIFAILRYLDMHRYGLLGKL